MFFGIKSAIAPLFAKASDEAERVDEVLHGWLVQVLEEAANNWALVRTDYDYEGWVEKKYLCPPLKQQATHYVNAVAADVLSEPKVQANVLISLTLGCTVSIITDDEQAAESWAKINLADGRCGFIRSSHLTPLPSMVAGLNLNRNALCDTALKYRGAQYRWGGKTPLGIDCSGLVFMAYRLNGFTIYRDAKIHPAFPIKQPVTDCNRLKNDIKIARKGDLLYFPGHVGMFINEKFMLHSSETRGGVSYEALTPDWLSRITAIGSLSV